MKSKRRTNGDATELSILLIQNIDSDLFIASWFIGLLRISFFTFNTHEIIWEIFLWIFKKTKFKQAVLRLRLLNAKDDAPSFPFSLLGNVMIESHWSLRLETYWAQFDHLYLIKWHVQFFLFLSRRKLLAAGWFFAAALAVLVTRLSRAAGWNFGGTPA